MMTTRGTTGELHWRIYALKRRRSLSIGDDIQITYEWFTGAGTNTGSRGNPFFDTKASIRIVVSGPNKHPWPVSLKPGEAKGIWEADFGGAKDNCPRIIVRVDRKPRPNPSLIHLAILQSRAVRRLTPGLLWERRPQLVTDNGTRVF